MCTNWFIRLEMVKLYVKVLLVGNKTQLSSNRAEYCLMLAQPVNGLAYKRDVFEPRTTTGRFTFWLLEHIHPKAMSLKAGPHFIIYGLTF